jgi:hypothetical protein
MTVVVTHTTPADGSFSTTGAAAWNANHTLSGVGTMAGQDANAVAITGGSISGVSGIVTSVAATAGTGISITGSPITSSGTLNITNTAPDQTVVLTAGTGISTSGTYPNFTITNTSPSSGGTVTSVSGTGTVNGLSLSGTVTSSGNLTFGGTLDLSSPPAIGSTAASTGAFTTLSASSTVSGTGFSTYLASPPAIGGTAAAAGTFTTLIGGSGSANYEQITGGATGKAVQFQSLGSDAAVSLAIQSKGTGAIDLAAGSSGVNISNGGTVTGITRTANGSAYTSIPSLAISAPTTAGGVQAVATPSMLLVGATVQSGGTGYTVADTLTVVGGTGAAAILTVSTVSSGAVTGVTINSGGFGNYSVLPTNPVSVTGGTGSGATFNLTSYGLSGSFTISNAGSGYVEQPTVTFSGGGGSGAAAYATVGSGTVIRTLGSTVDFYTPSQQIAFRVQDNATVNTGYWTALGGTTSPILRAIGIGAGRFDTASAVPFSFLTNTASSSAEQLRIAHTTSAVNYVQVTGAATGTAPTLSSQGSDGNIGFSITPKGTFGAGFKNSLGSNIFTVNHSNTSTQNYLNVASNTAGSAPSISSLGTDTDIQLSLVPKGLGIVLMNQQTPAAVTATGTLTIANLLTQIITSTSATAVSLTLPTGTLSDAGISGGTSAVNTSFDYSIINTGSAVGDVTMVAGTAHTIVGSVSIPVGTTGRFRCRKTATNTFVSYRV